MGTHRLGSLRFAHPYASRWLTVHAVSRASLGEGACLSRALSARAAPTSVPSMLRRPTGPRQNAHFGRPKPSSAMIASTGVARVPIAVALGSRGTPRWPRPDSPRRVNGFSTPTGPKHLLPPLRSFFPLRLRAHPAPAATDPETVRSSFRMTAEASAVFQPTLGTSVCLWSRPLNRCPPSSEEAPPAGDQCGPWRVASQVPSSVRANPLFALLPVSPRYRRFRHRLVILGGWVTPTSFEPVETFMTRRPIPPAPSTIDVRSAGASHTPSLPRELRNAFGTIRSGTRDWATPSLWLSPP
jgi:hypothetical protein